MFLAYLAVQRRILCLHSSYSAALSARIGKAYVGRTASDAQAQLYCHKLAIVTD